VENPGTGRDKGRKTKMEVIVNGTGQPRPQAPSNGRTPAGNTVKARVARKLLGELAFALTGTSATELMKPPRGAKGLKAAHDRLLFRRADSLTDADIRKIVAEIGTDRVHAAVIAVSCGWEFDSPGQPQLPLAAAE
jgi:hypothetical protein